MGLSIMVLIMLLGLVVTLHARTHYSTLFVIMGWVERIGYWCYCLPQWLKNYRDDAAVAISPFFLGLSIVTALCDSISAWCFSWGPSSLYGAPVAVLVHMALFCQCYRRRAKGRLAMSSCEAYSI